MTITRPPRTAAHATLQALLAQFRDAGLVPVVSTNGGIPEADIQVVKGAKPGEVLDVWSTDRGRARFKAICRCQDAGGVGSWRMVEASIECPIREHADAARDIAAGRAREAKHV